MGDKKRKPWERRREAEKKRRPKTQRLKDEYAQYRGKHGPQTDIGSLTEVESNTDYASKKGERRGYRHNVDPPESKDKKKTVKPVLNAETKRAQRVHKAVTASEEIEKKRRAKAKKKKKKPHRYQKKANETRLERIEREAYWKEKRRLDAEYPPSKLLKKEK